MNTTKSIEEIHEMLINNKITSEELVKEAIDKSYEINKLCNAFVTIIDNPLKESNDILVRLGWTIVQGLHPYQHDLRYKIFYRTAHQSLLE